MITTEKSGARSTGFVLQMCVVVPADADFYQLQGFIIEHSEYNFIVLRIVLYSVPLHQKHWGASENPVKAPESTLLCVRPVWEILEASGRFGVAVQNSWVVELWHPNHITFCWCAWMPQLSKLRYALVGHDCVNLKVMIESVWSFTWMLS